MKRGEAVRILVSIALATFVFSGCATTPIRASDAQRIPAERLYAFQERTEKSTASIIVTRDVGFVGSGCYVAVRVNGVRSATFDFGETASFYVEPGETVVSVGYDTIVSVSLCSAPEYRKTVETYLRPGEAKFYRVTFVPGGYGPDIIRSEIK
ncbi:MAG: hypothetical protein ACYC7K_00490 [Desulfobacteria bacterium]